VIRSSRAWVIALLVLWAIGPTAPAATVPEAIPAQVYVLIDIPDLPAARANGIGSAYGDIMAEPDVQRFLDAGFPALSGLGADFNSFTGKGFREILDYCRGEAALVVMPDGEAGAAVVVILNVGADKEDFKKFLADCETKTGLLWLESPATAAEGPVIRSAARGDLTISYCMPGDFFVLANSVTVLESVSAGLLSAPEENLASNESYVKCRSLAAVEHPEVVAYSDVSFLVSQFMPMLPEAAGQIATDLGLDCTGAVYYASSRKDKGFVDTALFYFPDGRTGLFAAIKPSERDAKKLLSMMPADSIAASWTCVDMPGLADTFTSVYDAMPSEAKSQVDQFVSDFEAAAGVKLKDDIVASLGQHIVSYTPLPSGMMGLGMSGGFGQGVTLVELSDEARFEKALAAVWKYAIDEQSKPSAPSAAEPPSGGTEDEATPEPEADLQGGPPPVMQSEPKAIFATEKFGDKTIYQVQMPVNPAFQVVPSAAVARGWLVIGGDAQSVKNALSGPLELPQGLSQNGDFASASRYIGNGNAGMSYVNTRAFFDMLYPLVTMGLPILAAQAHAGLPIDQMLLPAPETVSSHLFGSATAINVTDDSIRTVSYGPVGNVRSAYAALVAASAAAKWFAESQGMRVTPSATAAPAPAAPAAPEPVSPDMGLLGDALTRYAGHSKGAYPPTLDELKAAGDLRTSGGVTVDLSLFRYVWGLKNTDDKRLILAFDATSGPGGRRVLLVGSQVMHYTDSEIAEQAGGWLDMSEGASESEMDQACITNLTVLAASIKRYADSHEGKVPSVLDLSADYLFAPMVTTCPSDPTRARPGYATIDGLTIPNVPVGFASEAILVYETGSRHGGQPGVVFLDGTAKRMSVRDLRKAVEWSGTISRMKPKSKR